MTDSFSSTSQAQHRVPEFDDLANVFWRLGALQSPSELQGYLAGQLAVGVQLKAEQWLDQAAAYIDCVDQPAGEDSRSLMDLYTATSTQLMADELDFQLLLPDDTVDLVQRVECLGQWCQGFLTGFAMAGKQLQQHKGQRQYSSEVSEILSDMAAISQIGASDEDDGQEQSEQDFFEICEYLRLGAITVYLECHHQQDTQQPDNAADDSSNNQLH